MKKVEAVKMMQPRGWKNSLRSVIAAAAFSMLYALSSALPAGAVVPVKFTYQGNLRQAGVLVNGTRSMIFRIYSSSTSAVALWTSPAPVNVDVSTGVFRVTIEPTLPVTADWDSGSLWLELVIGGVKMSPREEITSSPYSVNSLLLGGKRYVTAALEPSIAHPHAAGDLWMDTTTNTLKFWNGFMWIDTVLGALPGPHAASHDVGGSDPVLDLGPHNVSGAITFDSVGELRAGGSLSAITIAANAVVQNALSVNGGVTASSVTATGAGVSASRVALSNNVIVSSEAAAGLGGGVRVSSNVYIVGFASATRFYGDGSQLTGIVASIGDNLGSHIATKHLGMGGFDISNAGYITASSGSLSGPLIVGGSVTVSGALGLGSPRLALSDNVAVSSETDAALGGGVRVSSNVYIVGFASAAYFYGDGSHLTGLTAVGDNLGNHTATTMLNMGGYGITNAASGSFASAVTASSFTATGAGIGAAQLRLGSAANLVISSETDTALGGGVRVSSNVYIVGFASAAYFYGDGSRLTGIVASLGDNLGNHIATTTLNMNGQSMVNVASGTFNKNLTVYSTVTILSPETEASSLWVSTSNVTPQLYVSTGGNVGIGTASPGADLEVAGNASPGGYITVWKSGNNVAAWLRNK